MTRFVDLSPTAGMPSAVIRYRSCGAIDAALESARPSIIACRTTIGYGSPTKSGTAGSHGSPLGEEEIAATREVLNWQHEPFVIPNHILDCWRSIGGRGSKARKDWFDRLTKSSKRQDFERAMSGKLPVGWEQTLIDAKKYFSE